MKIYGRTDTLIVREMVEDDCEQFLELMTERGTNEDFTVEDIRVLWDFRKKKGDIQCTVTSIDGKTIYGFAGILRGEICVDLLNKYIGYEEEARTIIIRLQ